jgi:uncharacterized damage-inducible protein DinB
VHARKTSIASANAGTTTHWILPDPARGARVFAARRRLFDADLIDFAVALDARSNLAKAKSSNTDLGAPMPTIREFIAELEQEAVATRRTLERVPIDKHAWKPHEKSQTLGQLAMHVATIPKVLSEVSMLAEFDAGFVVPRPEATSMDELLGAHDSGIARAREVIGGMDDAALATPWKMMQGTKELVTLPRGVFLRSVLFNHWYHHRGQLTVYLRQTGALVPAIYGGSADEIPFQG